MRSNGVRELSVSIPNCPILPIISTAGRICSSADGLARMYSKFSVFWMWASRTRARSGRPLERMAAATADALSPGR